MPFVMKQLDQPIRDQLSGRLRGPCVQLQRWFAVDEQSGVALISLGATSYAREDNPLDYLNLLWGDSTIAIEAKTSLHSDEDGTVLVFRMTKLVVPEELHLDIDLIRQAIEGAAGVYWGTSLRTPVTARATLPPKFDRA